MSAEFTRADTIREYLSGAASDGGAQPDPDLSLGDRRSSTEVVSLGIVLASAIPNVYVDFASGANPIGAGSLMVEGTDSLRWKPFGDAGFGPPAVFSGVGEKGLVEALDNPGKFLRVTATTPFNPGTATVTLSHLRNSLYGFLDVSISDAAAGVSHYRASIVKNVGGNPVTAFVKYIATLGTARVSSISALGAAGAGSITGAAGVFDDWPLNGWCQVRTSAGALREVVYYNARTSTVLTVPAAGRSLLGTVASAGALTDNVYSVPGVAIGKDPAGVQAAGSAIQVVANATTAPAGVTWNLGITPADGLSIGTLNPGEQIGIWLWRRIPAGAVSNASHLTKVWDSYNAF